MGALTPNGDHYDVTNARVVWPTGESKQWTPDGKGVIIQGGAFEAGNVDDILVDLSGQTGTELYPGSDFLGTRVTGDLDYDEDIDMSPNMQWITVGSLRGDEALTPMTGSCGRTSCRSTSARRSTTSMPTGKCATSQTRTGRSPSKTTSTAKTASALPAG